MPRLVDREERRRAIIEVTWRLLATRGPEAATMREIARAAGYANGALAPYFTDKRDLIEGAWAYVFERTNERIAAAVGGRRGLPALRAVLVEVLPTTEVALLEARIVLPFWGRSLTDERLARVHDEAMQAWRQQLCDLLAQARGDGDVTVAVPDELLAEQLLGLVTGMQVLGLLPDHPTPAAQQVVLLDAVLAGLGPR